MRQHAAEHIDLSATPENSRELQWFTQRYPLAMDADTQRALQQLADEHVDMERSLGELLAGRVQIPEFTLAAAAGVPAGGGAQLSIRGGLLLADDLGLGKTVTGICPMAAPGNLPAVVVYPAALPNHWPEKLAEFAPQLRVHHIRKSAPYPLVRQPRQRIKDLWDTLPDVILVSYHKLRGWAETLGRSRSTWCSRNASSCAARQQHPQRLPASGQPCAAPHGPYRYPHLQLRLRVLPCGRPAVAGLLGHLR